MDKVLIVDDDKVLNNAVAEYLSQNAFQIFQAYDALEGLKQYTKENPDIVLLDHFMPNMTGLEGLKEIRKKNPTALVIMITGTGSEKIAVESMKAGAEDYVTKPLRMSTLVSLVRMHIDRHRERLENVCRKEELETYNQYLAHNMERVNEAIISTDAEGNIKYINRAAEQFWLYKRKDVIDVSMWDILEKEKVNLSPQKIRDALFSTGKFKEEFRFLRKDKRMRYGLFSASFLKDDPIKAIVTVVTDLTRTKKMERRLVKSERMASLGHLADGVAHQVRNVLITLGGYANLLKKRMAPDDKNRAYIAPILESVDRLDDMVRDIENYARYTRKQEVAFHSVEILATVNRVIKKAFSTEKCRDVDVSLDISPEDIAVVGDSAFLNELFRQIIINACEAMTGKGNLGIKARERNDSVEIRVSDTGRGIPENDIPLIYDPFYTTKNRGAGIGLTIVSRILETHNGTIDIQSYPGEGTTLTVVIPRATSHKEQEAG
jgi:PAS domain S-box-containing protein